MPHVMRCGGCGVDTVRVKAHLSGESLQRFDRLDLVCTGCSAISVIQRPPPPPLELEWGEYSGPGIGILCVWEKGA